MKKYIKNIITKFLIIALGALLLNSVSVLWAENKPASKHKNASQHAEHQHEGHGAGDAHEHSKNEDVKQRKPKFHFGKRDPLGALVRVKLKGLVCDFCARALEKVFSKQKEVAGLAVNLREKILTISLKRGKQLSDGKITQLVQDAGYNVVNIQRKNARKNARKNTKEAG